MTMWLLMLAFWGMLIWAVFALVRATARTPPRREDGGCAWEVLDQRLAQGEIDEVECASRVQAPQYRSQVPQRR